MREKWLILVMAFLLSFAFCFGHAEEITFDAFEEEDAIVEFPEVTFVSDPEEPDPEEQEVVWSDPMDWSLFPEDEEVPELTPSESSGTAPSAALQSQEVVDAQNREMENWQENTVPARRGRMSISQLRAKYPAGKYWNHADYPGASDECNNPDHVTDIPCPENHNSTLNTELQTCNYFPGGWQCHGYVMKLGYDVTGTDPRSWQKKTNSSALKDLKAGDIVRYLNDGHSIFVIDVDGETVTFTECNENDTCVIRWDSTISKSELSKTFTYLLVCPSSDLVQDEYCHCSATATGYYTCTASSLPIYGSHCLGNNQIGTIPRGATVHLTMSDSTIAHVDYNGTSGYVDAKSLSRQSGFEITTNWSSSTLYFTIPDDNTVYIRVQSNKNIPNGYQFTASSRGATYDLEWKKWINARTIELRVTAKKPGDGVLCISLVNGSQVPVASYDVTFRTERARTTLTASVARVNINMDKVNNQTISLQAGGYLPGTYSFKVLRATDKIIKVTWPGNWNNKSHNVNIEGVYQGDTLVIFGLVCEDQVCATAAVNVSVDGTVKILPSRAYVNLNLKSLPQREMTLKLDGILPKAYSFKVDYESEGYKMVQDGDFYLQGGVRAVDVDIYGSRNSWGNIKVRLVDTKRKKEVASLDWPVYVWNDTFPAADLTIPLSVTEVGSESFRKLPVKVVKLPYGLRKVGSYAFADCPNLTTVYIPPTVAAIDSTAFNTGRTLMIYGMADSAAEEFAIQHNHWFVPWILR